MTDTTAAEATPGDATDVVDRVVRSAYGRLVSCLAAEARDLAGAEDALADAVERALRTWPERGVPKRPEAWLLTVARRRMIDGHRRRTVAERAEPTLQLLSDELAEVETAVIGDKRLDLLFVCAHPAIDATIRAPLMLQTVLGLDAGRIASAFLMKPSTMGQRLVRAKRKILAAGIAFRVPEPDELPARLDAVLDAIYAAFGTGWDSDPDAGLADEALRLIRIVAELLADQAPAHGLEALMLYSHARRDARRDDEGRFVPLAEQDTRRWDHDMIEQADQAIARAASAGPANHFTIEAMIQGTHAWRARTGTTDWATIASLYQALLRIAPNVGAAVGHAAALLEAEGPDAALRALDAIEHPRRDEYQPWWTVRAHALVRLDSPDAADAVRRAAGLTDDDAVRRHLLALLEREGSGP